MPGNGQRLSGCARFFGLKSDRKEHWNDYDTIWTVTLDAEGNLTVNNALCQGIDSASLPPTAPQY